MFSPLHLLALALLAALLMGFGIWILCDADRYRRKQVELLKKKWRERQ